MCHDSAAAHEREAGAPEQAIEITPEMIEAGILELREKCIGEDLAGIVTDVFTSCWLHALGRCLHQFLMIFETKPRDCER
jgi:hypothetical protein